MWRVKALTIVGFGAKATLPYGIELVVGVRDFFNREPNQPIIGIDNYSDAGVPFKYWNVDYPKPGQTIYATLYFTY
jgi:hypothetical protein